MASHVVQIEYRLRRLADEVENFNRYNEDVSICVTHKSDAEEARLDKLKMFNVKTTENAIKEPDDILLLSQCYLKLIKQTEFINTMFGFRVSIKYSLIMKRLLVFF